MVKYHKKEKNQQINKNIDQNKKSSNLLNKKYLYNLSSQEIYTIQVYYKNLKWNEYKIVRETGGSPRAISYALSTYVYGPMNEAECTRYKDGCGFASNMFQHKKTINNHGIVLNGYNLKF